MARCRELRKAAASHRLITATILPHGLPAHVRKADRLHSLIRRLFYQRAYLHSSGRSLGSTCWYCVCEPYVFLSPAFSFPCLLDSYVTSRHQSEWKNVALTTDQHFCMFHSLVISVVLSSVVCPSLQHFSIFSNNGTIFEKKLLNMKYGFDFLYHFIRNTSHSKKYSERYDQKYLVAFM